MQTKFIAKHTLKGHTGPIYDLAYDKITERLYSSGADKLVAGWSLKTLQNQAPNIRLEQSSYAITVDPENALLWIGDLLGQLHLVDLNKRQEIRNLAVHKHPIYKVVLSPKNQLMLSSDGNGNVGGWNAKTGDSEFFIKLSGDKIRFLALDHTEAHLWIGKGDGAIEVIELATLNQKETFLLNGQESPIFCGLEWKTEAQWIFGLKNGHISGLNLSNSKNQLHIPAHNFGVYNAIKQGDLLITSSRDASIKTWQLPQFEVLQKLGIKNGGHSRSVNKLISLGTNCFASAGDDGKIVIWEHE